MLRSKLGLDVTLKLGGGASFNPSTLTSPVAAIDAHESGGSVLYQASTGTGDLADGDLEPCGYAAQIAGFSATPAIQATTSAKPTLRTGANGINGHNALSFDGGDWLNWTGISAASGAKTVYVVISPGSATLANNFLFDTFTGRLVIAALAGTSGKVGWYDGAWREPANASLGAQILTFALTNPTGTLYRNNVSLGTAPYTNKAIGGNVALGQINDGSGFWFYTGLYGAIYIYNALHSEAERNAMHAYLSSRWGIS